jgi:hypothetical protein
MRDQSARVDVWSAGSFASSAPISSSDIPIRCAKTMKAMRAAVREDNVGARDEREQHLE